MPDQGYFFLFFGELIMRDKRFVAVHRGGPLSREDHRRLILWAADCAEHVLPLSGDKGTDLRLFPALATARAWAQGEISVGDARKASVGAHAIARESRDPVATAVARAVGHAVATAHMADHALGSAYYALKAVRAAGKSPEAEQRWQVDRLPPEIRDLVLSAWEMKFAGKKSGAPKETA